MMTSFERFMAENGLAQKTVAEYLGVSQPRISHYAKDDSIPLEKRIQLINNPYGWDASMLENDYTEAQERQDTVGLMDIIRQVLKDYQERLTDRDESIKEIARAVVVQNERLNDILKRIMEAKVF